MINQLRKIISDYFGFHRTETNGLMLIFILMFILIFIPYIFRKINSAEIQITSENKILLDSLVTSIKRANIKKTNTIELSERIDLFNFNPNISSVKELEMLNIDKKIASRIVNYRKAGGTFNTKKDLRKIYGLSKDTYDRLYEFIDLPEKLPVRDVRKVNTPTQTVEETPESGKNIETIIINLNFTDTAELKKIKGIGNILSSRIIKYGGMLGGYVSVHQLKDVYGLKGDALEQIKTKAYISEDFEPVKLKINFADWYTLVKHPYIDKDLANELISTRSNNGPFRKISDLTKIRDISDSLLLNLDPYLEF